MVIKEADTGNLYLFDGPVEEFHRVADGLGEDHRAEDFRSIGEVVVVGLERAPQGILGKKSGK